MASSKSVQREGHQFDENVARIRESTAKGGADRQLQMMSTIVSFVAERFGVEEDKATRQLHHELKGRHHPATAARALDSGKTIQDGTKGGETTTG